MGFLLQVQGQRMAVEEARLLETAQSFYMQMDFHQAKEVLDKLIQKYPRNNAAYFLRGEIRLIYLRDMDGSLADSKMAISLAPKVPGVEKVYNNIGLVYQFKREDAKALMYFEKAISINPKYAPPHNGRGVILEKKGNRDEALKEFDLAINLNPDNLGPYVGRADLRFKRRDFEGALSDITKTVNGDNNYPSHWIRRGMIYAEMGYWELAVSDLEKGFQIAALPENQFSRMDIVFNDLDEFVIANPKDARALAARAFVWFLRSNAGRAEADLAASYLIDSSLKDQLKELVAYIKVKTNSGK